MAMWNSKQNRCLEASWSEVLCLLGGAFTLSGAGWKPVSSFFLLCLSSLPGIRHLHGSVNLTSLIPIQGLGHKNKPLSWGRKKDKKKILSCWKVGRWHLQGQETWQRNSKSNQKCLFAARTWSSEIFRAIFILKASYSLGDMKHRGSETYFFILVGI